MPRICLITPGHLSTNPRIVKEADALVGAGYDVTVVAADYLGWAREADRDFRERGWTVVEKVQFGPLAPKRLRVRQVLRQRSCRILMRAGVRSPSIVNAACHPAAPELVRAAMRVKADLYIAHYPAALRAAALAAKKHKGLYAFDAEDYHLGEFPDDRVFEPQRAIIRALETAYLPGTAYLTAASPGISSAYAETYGVQKPIVILNVFPLSEAPHHSTPAGEARPGPSIYWFSQTIGPNRGLECAIKAVALSKTRPHLYLRGAPAAGFAEALQALADRLGIARHLHLLPTAPPSEMVRLAAPYDVGLASEPGYTLNNRIALSNKQFTYLMAGLPIIASDTAAHRSIAVKIGHAMKLYGADEPLQLADLLDSLFDHRTRLASLKVAAFDLSRARFNWEVESKMLIEITRRTLISAGKL